MSADEPKQPSLEQVLWQFLSDSGTQLDLKKLLAERPDVARQLRQVLDEHERSTAVDQPTLMHDSGGQADRSQ